MHPLDIPMVESGGPFRPMRAAPGLLRRVLCKLLYHSDERLEPVAIDQLLTAGKPSDGQVYCYVLAYIRTRASAPSAENLADAQQSFT
jgi:hypothetical protein